MWLKTSASFGQVQRHFKNFTGACFAVRAVAPDSPVLIDDLTPEQLIGRPLIKIASTDLVADHVDATKTLNILKQALEHRPCELVLGPSLLFGVEEDNTPSLNEAIEDSGDLFSRGEGQKSQLPEVSEESDVPKQNQYQQGKRQSITFKFPDTQASKTTESKANSKAS